MAYDSDHGKLWQDSKADLDKLRARASKFAEDAQWAFGRRTVRVLGVVVLFAVVVALLLVFLDLYIAPTKPSQKKDLVLAMAQILAGAALLSGLYFTWRTLQVNREGQITERFTRAIEQLGATHDDNSKSLELRLGGIYALERIARESEEDQRSIMEVLTAYVRQHAPWPPEEAQQQVEEDATVEKKSEEGSREKSEHSEVPDLAADIRAIMTVIGRRTRAFKHGEHERLDLRETNLGGANFGGANFEGADLSGANLTKANLARAYLSAVNLLRANLGGANLKGADLSGADLRGAYLSGADLTDAVLTEAVISDVITEAGFTEADLSGAILSGADLRGAVLKGTTLREAHFTGADLSGADLTGADLTDAGLVAADLTRADLTGATLSGADLRTVYLKEANLSKANLSRAVLPKEKLEDTIGDKNTKLPPYLKPPAHWNVRTDEQTEGT